MDFETAMRLMANQGYCLWVGAGVAMHAARAGGEEAPGWETLVADLEAAATLRRPPSGVGFPERLDLVRYKQGLRWFQRELRTRVHDPVSRGLIEAARRAVQHDPANPSPPSAVRHLAKLGTLANPIVNFNIETLTSWLLAGGEPFATKTFVPHTGGRTDFGGRGPSATQPNRHMRAIYHPHGTITAGGLCVVTASDYKAMTGTLALQLAVHAAFQSHLAIVGMSLADSYLREQIAEFRDQIDLVLWFTDAPPLEEVLTWTIVNRVDVLSIGSWQSFWEGIEQTLPGPGEQALRLNWMSVFSSAVSGLTGEGELRTIDSFRGMGVKENELVKIKNYFQMTGIRVPDVGEPPEATMTRPSDADDIMMRLFGSALRIGPEGSEKAQ